MIFGIVIIKRQNIKQRIGKMKKTTKVEVEGTELPDDSQRQMIDYDKWKNI